MKLGASSATSCLDDEQDRRHPLRPRPARRRRQGAGGPRADRTRARRSSSICFTQHPTLREGAAESGRPGAAQARRGRDADQRSAKLSRRSWRSCWRCWPSAIAWSCCRTCWRRTASGCSTIRNVVRAEVDDRRAARRPTARRRSSAASRRLTGRTVTLSRERRSVDHRRRRRAHRQHGLRRQRRRRSCRRCRQRLVESV